MTPTATVSPPAAPLLTAGEFMARYEQIHAELVKGVVEEYPVPGFKHGAICSRIDRLLASHIEANDLGRTAINDTWLQTGHDPDTIRGADFLFISYERLPKGPMPEGLLTVAPDLIVEVRSPTDRWTDVFGKVLEYLKAGVRVVILLDPGTETASVYRPEELQRILHNGDALEVPDILPGFSVPVRRMFE